MSASSEHICSSGSLDAGCIDRLVGGELPEDARRALLLRLDAAPDGWRQCALAFLEAQMWRESFAQLETAASAERPMPAPVMHASKSKLGRRLAQWSVLAACIAVAFVLGWSTKPIPSTPRSAQTQVVAIEPAPGPEFSRTNVSDTPVERAKTTDPIEKNPLVDSVVAYYERQGYAPERQKRVVTVKLEDGRERQVQAEEVRLRFVGDRTY